LILKPLTTLRRRRTSHLRTEPGEAGTCRRGGHVTQGHCRAPRQLRVRGRPSRGGKHDRRTLDCRHDQGAAARCRRLTRELPEVLSLNQARPARSLRRATLGTHRTRDVPSYSQGHTG